MTHIQFKAPPEIPPRIKAAIDHYVEGGYTPGGFVMAVLSNDLTQAVLIADNESLSALPAIVRYVYNHIPHDAWGSPEITKAWEKRQ